MWQLLAKIVLGLTVALLIPTALVLASQNAVPGDKIYPLKRTLENGITAMASLNSATKVYFKTDFSRRRFDEVMVLINRGDNVSLALDELVGQTKAAKDSIIAMSDKNLRKQFAGNLSSQIDNYNKALTGLGNNKRFQQATPTPIPGQSITPVPSVPSPNPSDYDRTQDELRRIKEELERLKKQLNDMAAANQNPNNAEVLLISTPTPTAEEPTPTLTGKPTFTPVPTKQPDNDGKCSAMDILRRRLTGGTDSATPCKSTPTIPLTPTPTIATDGASIQGVSIKISDLREKLFEIITNFFR